MSLSPIEVEDAPSQPVLQSEVHATGPELGARIGAALSQLVSSALSSGARPGPTFVRRTKGGATVGVCVRVSEVREGQTVGELPAGPLARGVWTGDFASRLEGLAALEAAARAAGYAPAGAPWEMDLTGPHDVARPEEARTQLYLPVRKA